jgi:hypothetical protein
MMTAMAGTKKTLYEILGVPRDASPVDIAAAYPQRKSELEQAVPQDPGAQALLHQAHEVLADPQRRAGYDASLARASEKAVAAEAASAADLGVAPGDETVGTRLPWAAIAVAAVVVLGALVFGLRTRSPQAPLKPEPVAEAPKPVVAPPPIRRTSAQILADALPAVARLQSFEMSGRGAPVGLALAVEPGAMITTCHGLPAGSQLVATVGAQTHSAALAVTDEVLDLCRLNVAGFGGAPLALATEEPRIGDTLYALGANAAGEFALTEGTVRHLHKQPQGNVIEISVPIAPTASGGAVFDTYGKVVGIATTPHPYGNTVNAVLPATWIPTLRSRGK